MLSRISNYIARHNLLDLQKRYLVALSGGADSVCLLLVLQKLGYQVEAVHCNFHLRGEESDRDEQFCEQLCKDKNIRFHRVHFDTRAYASLHHISIEMAARELRYHYFDQLLQSIDAECVCVAHHQDDIAETMLINLLRGTGIHGLTGIQPRRGNVVRPLLCVSREEIIQFLGSIGQDYVTDSTNLQDDVLRNHLRLNVMPLLRQATSAAVENIVATARRISDASQLYDKAVTAQLADDLVSQTPYATTYRLSELLLMESLLFEALSPFGFTPKQVEDMHSALLKRQEARGKKQEARGKRQEAGGEASQWSSSTHTAVTHGDNLIIYQNDDPHLAVNVEPHVFPIEGRYQLGALGTFDLSTFPLGSAACEASRSKNLSTFPPSTAFLDADKVVFPLHLRPVATGDRFQPFGMKGTKLVSDYLTDRKRSLYEKRCQLVMTDETGEILWLVGERIDQRFAVTDSTEKVVKVEMLKG